MLGKNIEEDFTETKQDIGVVLDEPSFPEYVTADQMNNIMKNIYRNWDEKRYYELIDQFELPKWKKQFKNYSNEDETCNRGGTFSSCKTTDLR